MDMYQDSGREEVSVWNDRAFRRWFLYWCTPVWGGFLALLFLLVFPCDPVHVAPPAFLWMVYSTLFVFFESAELIHWGNLIDEDLRYIPTPFHRRLKALSGVAEKKMRGNAQTVASLSSLTVFSLYLGLAHYLCS
ncbi:MAG: hypothetical protein ACRERU_23975 [Methylococcales bacterium]